MVSLETFVQNS